MAKMTLFDWIAYFLVVIGALNWGIYGVSRLIKRPFDLVTSLLGTGVLSNILFILVGIAGIVGFITAIKLMGGKK